MVEFARLLFQPLLLFCVQEQADAEEPKDAVLASLKSVDHRPEAQDFTLQYVGVRLHAPFRSFQHDGTRAGSFADYFELGLHFSSACQQV